MSRYYNHTNHNWHFNAYSDSEQVMYLFAVITRISHTYMNWIRTNVCFRGKWSVYRLESKKQKDKQAPECLLVTQVAAEWHAERDPIRPANTMGALWCESGSWAGITDGAAQRLATGHWHPSTRSGRREMTGSDQWSPWGHEEVKSPSHTRANNETHVLLICIHLHT